MPDHPPVVKSEIPVLICVMLKVTVGYDANGDSMPWSLNLSESLKVIPPDEYFRVNKSCIIARSVIIEIIDRKDERLDVKLSMESPVEIIVSRRNTVAFKRWLHQKPGTTEETVLHHT